MTKQRRTSMAIAVLALASFPVAAGRAEDRSAGPPAAGYEADFVATAAFGVAMNDAGDVTGTSYPDPGCGPFCLPVLETVVWRDGERIVLPAVPGLTGITVRSVNDQGWVAGLAGFPYTTNHAVVWKPVGAGYQAIDLGTLPGTTSSEAVGIDDLGRAVGWSTTLNFPPNGSPFLWTESSGMIDLSALGFPDEVPLATSPGGAVATASAWYLLEDPGSVVSMPVAPQGFAIGSYPTAIADDGGQARFLVSTGAENLRYLFRFHEDGIWQQISFAGNGDLSPYGVGSIDVAGDVTATVLGAGQVAYGPGELTQPLADLLSPAYRADGVTVGGPMNAAGQILAQVMIGRSPRLMRLTPAEACTADCIQVKSLNLRARFVEDPEHPGQCTQGGGAYNRARVRLKVTTETGAPLAGASIAGRFLDDYWTNALVAGTTNASGVVQFVHTGLCGVGAVAFLVDDATAGSRDFDRTVGVLSGWAIPE